MNVIQNNNQPLPLERSASDSQVKLDMITGTGSVPHNNVPVVAHKKKTHVVKKEVINSVNNGEPFNSAHFDRRSNGHNVTNVSVTARQSDAQPSVVQVKRRFSGDIIDDSFSERRGIGHSVTNVSVKSHSNDGQSLVQLVRRASGDDVDGDVTKRRGSSHSVKNMSVTSRTTEVQPSFQGVRRTSGDGGQIIHHGNNTSGIKGVSVTSRTTEGQRVVRRSSADLVDGAPLQSNAVSHSVGQQSSNKFVGVIRVAHQSDDGWNRNVDDIPRPNSFGGSDQSSTDVR